MKRENLRKACDLDKKIDTIDKLINIKVLNEKLYAVDKHDNVFQLSEEGSNALIKILEKERNKLVIEYDKLNRE
jgi:hypothetical protein